MKKIFTTLAIALLSLVQVAPVMAADTTSTKPGLGSQMKELRQELNKERKEVRDEFKAKEKEARTDMQNKMKDVREEFKDKMQNIRDELKKKQEELKHRLVRRELMVRGELTALSGTAVPATLSIKVSGVWPDFHKQWESVSSSTFPAKDKIMTVKVDEKTKVVRRFNGKSGLDELTIGDTMQIMGRLNEDGSVSARVVKDNSIQMTHHVYHGMIASLDAVAKSFSMTLMSSSSVSFTVKTDSNTKFMIPGVTSTSFANLKVSDKVWVRGVVNTRTKVIDANVVKVKPPAVVPAPTPNPTSTPNPTPTPTSTATST